MKDVRVTTDRISVFRDKEKKKLTKKFFLFGFVFLVLLVFIFYILTLNFWNIDKVEISGNSIVKTEDIVKVVDNQKSGNILFFIKKTNILFFSIEKLKDKLYRDFPRIQEINIKKASLKNINIEIKERVAVLLWCGDTPRTLNATDESCFYLDDNGFLFSNAPYFSGPVRFIVFGKSNFYNTEKNIGEQIFTKDEISSFLNIERDLNDNDITPYGLYKNDKDIIIFLSRDLTLDKKIIKINTQIEIAEALSNLFTAFESKDFKERYDTYFNDLLYLDLRFNNKVYFKYDVEKNETK